MAMDFTMKLLRIEETIADYEKTPSENISQRTQLEGKVNRLVQDLQSELQEAQTTEDQKPGQKKKVSAAAAKLNRLETDFLNKTTTQKLYELFEKESKNFRWY